MKQPKNTPKVRSNMLGIQGKVRERTIVSCPKKLQKFFISAHG
jgi:hypothetical protein